VKKKTVIRIYLVIGWLMIALIMMTATGAASYDNIKYFFWMVPVSTAVLYLLYMNGKPYSMPEEEIKSILALVFTFVCLIMAFFASILLGH
jgi:heme/copper-type cytochrome/quinol oxidase subunit 4